MSTPTDRGELRFVFDQIVRRYIDDDFVQRDELVARLAEAVPTRAFDPIDPADQGMLFFHSDIEEQHVVPLQQKLLRTHLNLAVDVPVKLFLSSVGGNVFAGLALVSTINSLQRLGRQVHVHIEGVAMSMASVIAQAANYRTMEASAFFMLHEVWYRSSGRVSDHSDERAFQERLQDTLYEIYAQRTGKSIEYYRKKLYKTDWYLNADEALREGLVDAILTAPGVTTTKSPSLVAVSRRG
ncbi:MAG: Clp protease ClpP [Candidatus Eremiobacteraeota bacterium]|nr:Clp protease ClpP [Candidatus Eremiobacteraeota bacterium]